ncbi:hypothetical protein V6N11_038516 [Hibiscus sabdariffa]|uniref:AAA+ ATPase domain-containing protein n=1 Tax=Hibiscus sabdariffa TaxID=183260 RepID=A0ABR2SL49_9ROSI
MELPVMSPVSGARKAPYRLETRNLSYKLSTTFEDYFRWIFWCGRNRDRPAKFILKGVDCEARPGQITAIAGLSGAGKTTLLEILAGKIPPCEVSSGEVLVNALHTVTLLKSMAVNQGKTIVLTIHQPGFRILELFDRIVLLSNGSVVHNGELNYLEERLKLADHGIPRHVNVLEFAIDVIETLAVPNPSSPSNVNQEGCRIRSAIHLERKLLIYPNSRFDEVLILGQRFCSNIFRTKQLFATRVIQALVAGIVLGTIYFNVGNDKGTTALQTRTGFFAFTLTFLLSSTTEGLPIFLQERRILMRETSRGAYRVSSYVLANTIVFLPFLLMVSLLFTSPVYWLVGLRQDAIDGFLYFSLVVWMVLLMSNSFVACFSALVPNFIMGNSVIAGLMGSFFLFSGYFIAKDKIPNYWVFMHYLSLFKYPFECFMINEFGGKQGEKKCIEVENGECSLFGSWFLRQQGLEDSQKWSNLAVMLGFIVGPSSIDSRMLDLWIELQLWSSSLSQ